MTTISVIETDTPGQTLIHQLDDNGVESHSWAPDVIPVEARLNPDAPPASDMREGHEGVTYSWAMPDAEAWRVMTGGSEADRLAFRAAMKARGFDVEREVGLILP